MSEKEHPAATAGRFLRAAGDAVQKELARRAAEAEEKKKAEAAAAPAAPQTATTQPSPQTATAQPPPQAKASPTAPEKTAAEKEAAAAARRAARQKPPLEPRPILDRVLWLVFMVGLIALALSGLQIQMLASGSTETGIRLVLGIPLVVIAILVLTNWGRANERIVTRIFRMWGLEHPTTTSGRFARRFAKEALTLVGIILLAVAAFQLMSALVN